MTTMPSPLALSPAVPLPFEPDLAPSAPASRVARAIGYTLLALLVTVSFLYTGFHAYIAWQLSHPYVAPLASNPQLAKNLTYADISFPSSDGRSMVDGWWVPAADSARTVVLSHGYGANREESWVPMYDLADLLHRMGYNVLMFDYGFASAKHRTPATGGVTESKQLLGAIQYARSHGSEELVVWGFSMGAGTALQAALQQAPVDAMILDSTFLPSADTVYYNLQQLKLGLPKFPTIPLIERFLPLMTGAGLEKVPAAQAQTTAFDFPVFLIHGTADLKAPTYLSENVAKAQTDPRSRLWVVQGALHEMIYRTHTEEYVSRVTDFLGSVAVAAD